MTLVVTVETMAVDDLPTTTVNDPPEIVNVPASTETKGNTAVFLFYILLLSCEFLTYRQLYSFIAHTIKL